MKLSFSNIAWSAEQDEKIYGALAARGFSGVEIAPTRLFPEAPYDRCADAALFAQRLRAQHGLAVPSMQSIWFGRSERVFGASDERAALLAYTEKAVAFAAAIGCRNLVFGCPKNRSMPADAREETALEFFRAAGELSAAKNCIFALEANPPIYNTNYLNTTAEAFAAAKQCGPGVGVNLDFGTIIENVESLEVIADNLGMVSHVHISEPYLAPIVRRAAHKELAQLLRAGGYGGYVSAEMKRADPDEVLRVMDYIAEIFG